MQRQGRLCSRQRPELTLGQCCAGPGKAWTALEQGEFLFQLAKRKPSFIKVPVGLMDAIIGVLDFAGRLVPQWEVSRLGLSWHCSHLPVQHPGMRCAVESQGVQAPAGAARSVLRFKP